MGDAVVQELIKYTEETFAREGIDLLTKHAVTGVDALNITVKTPTGTTNKIPYGLFLWASGVTTRPLVSQLSEAIGKGAGQGDRRGLVVDEHLGVKGTQNVWAVGDCALAGLAPTAQVAFQQGAYLGRLFNNLADDLNSRQSPSTLPAR